MNGGPLELCAPAVSRLRQRGCGAGRPALLEWLLLQVGLVSRDAAPERPVVCRVMHHSA